MMEFGIPADDIDRIRSIFAAFPEIKQVILFGSRAMGNYKPGSDIDLAIIGDAVTFDTVLEINDRLEQLDLLYRFDIQNMNAVRDADIRDHIYRVGKTFFSRV